ncbi:hypothetical protein J0H58_21725 [bacterium]|nr:hypothetical protein [bacterium]
MAKRFLSLIALVGVFAGVGAAANLPGLRLHSANGPALTIKFTPTLRAGIPGGVAFPGVAESADGETITGIEYIPGNEDGQRLRLTLSDRNGEARQVSPKLYDWQLGPIARYADDAEHDSLVTYRGIEPKKGFKFQYHSAIQGNLLGMRLWHADFLLFMPQLAILDAGRVDLPTDETTGEYIFGAGESVPDVAANRKRWLAVSDVLQNHRGWESYVICDKGRKVEFGLNRGAFTISGYPVWWFFSTAPDGMGVVSHDRTTQAVTAVMEEHGGVNPAVYGATVVTMRYSALFRRAKQDAPAAWTRFVADVTARRLGKPADTPGLVELLPALR